MIAAAPASDVRSTLRHFILHNFYIANPASLSDESSLLDSGIIDSTGVLELVGFLEHDLGLTVADAELVPENLDTVSRLVAFVERKRKG
ncbi:acyl carrier protein [Archangium sp.]|jgi:acyl carrier protein|uniref:acyl carrier protein n=1 Tax=Archangium sp. TaxID=1872627 RepID=UPI002ED9E656